MIYYLSLNSKQLLRKKKYNYNSEYAAYFLNVIKRLDIAQNTKGITIHHLHSNDLKDIEIHFPTMEEQTAIAQILSDMDNEIAVLETKRDKYKLLKDGMMQELLTGKIRLSISNQTQSEEKPQKQANVHFRRSVWAAEIADRLCDEPTFGHVKMEKLIFLTENMCGIDIGSNYHRDVAGPYDNRAIRSIDSQLKKQNWFDVQHRDKGYRYVPLTKRGGHKSYFNNYYSDVLPVFNNVIDTCRIWDTERCEIVATLYSAWKDLENTKQQYTDNDIINEVINNWNESKKRIPKERWQKALGWMRKNGFSPIDI
jgi:type I restriction enzyme S subunit